MDPIDLHWIGLELIESKWIDLDWIECEWIGLSDFRPVRFRTVPEALYSDFQDMDSLNFGLYPFVLCLKLYTAIFQDRNRILPIIRRAI